MHLFCLYKVPEIQHFEYQFYMRSFPKTDALENMGGLHFFKFTPVFNIEKMPKPLDGIITESVDLVNGRFWYDGYATFDSYKYKEVKKTGDQGTYYEKTLSCFVPQHSPLILKLFEEMDECKFILDIFDNNGNRIMAGLPEEGFEFSFDLDLGNVKGTNGHNITFKGAAITRSPFYQI